MESHKDKIIKLAQIHASDLLKRRWPNRYIATPILSISACADGLLEMGAIDNKVCSLIGKKLSLVYWVASRIEHKESDKSFDDKSFYNSLAWRKLRYSVLRENESTCKRCGRGLSDGIKLHVDHIKPRSKYPELALDHSNLRVLCEDCNLGKSDSDLE